MSNDNPIRVVPKRAKGKKKIQVIKKDDQAKHSPENKKKITIIPHNPEGQPQDQPAEDKQEFFFNLDENQENNQDAFNTQTAQPDYFARQNLILDEKTGEQIKYKSLLIIGAGAGGNEILKNLALMGFGYVTIVDDDLIEDSNLSRTTLFSPKDIGKSKAEVAAESLNQISLHESPSIQGIHGKIQDVGKKIFMDHDIVVSCVDTMNARAYINDWCVRLGKPLFEMGFEEFVIQISFFPNEHVSDPCMRGLIGTGDFSGKRQSCSNLKVEDNDLEHIPTIQVAAAFAGVFVATEIILYLKGESRLKNKMLQYSAAYHRIMLLDVPKNKNCHLHEEVQYKKHFSRLTPEHTVKELLMELASEYNHDYFIKWNDEFIFSMDCEECRREIPIRKFKSMVYDDERWCETCRDKGYNKRNTPVNANWEIISELNLFNPKHRTYLDLKLKEFKIKPEDIIIAHNLESEEDKKLVIIQ